MAQGLDSHPTPLTHHGGLLRRAAGTAWSALAGLAARPYLAGESLHHALDACRRLRQQGMVSALGYWNTGDETPRQVAAAYNAALQAVDDPASLCLSVKAPALGFDPVLLEAILTQARTRKVTLHFDSHGLETADATFSCLKQAAMAGVRSGCTLPARWSRSAQDAERAIRLKVPVRLVKGQWMDPAFPGDPRASFLSLARRLAGRAVHVGVATHDPDLAAQALRALRRQRTPCEMELLYGLPMSRLVAIAREMDVRVRVYVPYGSGWLPYALSQARRNPRIVWWVMRDLVRGRSWSLPF
jgi:proline dehydrogenase